MFIITQYGDSALMIAAREGRTAEVVSLLLEAGANINLQNKVGIVSVCVRRGLV